MRSRTATREPGGRRRAAASWPPVAAVVRRAAAGDRRALATVLEAGYPRLTAFFRASGAPPTDAEDLAADVCEAVVRKLPRLREPVAFEAWFWSIGRSHIRNWIRAQRRGRRQPPLPLNPTPPDEQAEASDEHALIARALAMLTPRDRRLLWLREVEGLSYQEIGGTVRAATGTVRVACHRARSRLYDAYRRLGADLPD